MNTKIKPNDGMETMLSNMTAQMASWHRAAGGAIAEVAAGWLAPHYLSSVQERLAALPEGPERFKFLRLAVTDAALLHAGVGPHYLHFF